MHVEDYTAFGFDIRNQFNRGHQKSVGPQTEKIKERNLNRIPYKLFNF